MALQDSLPLRTLVVTASASLLLLRLTPAVAASGDLDPSFGDGGVVTTSIARGSVVLALLQQPDAKLVAAGDAGGDFGLARYHLDGSLDTSFGTGGTVRTFLSPDSDAAAAIVQQSDGKLVVAGATRIVTEFTSTPAIGLARYNGDGSLDATFGSGGVVVTNVGASSEAAALVLQPDGRLVVAGNSGGKKFALVRFNDNGTLDTSFGTGGKVTTDFGSINASANGLVLQPDGKLVAAGQSDTSVGGSFALARYNADGTLDPKFGANGKVVTDVRPSIDGANALLLQPDGKLVAAGFAPAGSHQLPRDFALVRYKPNGTVDTAFGTKGIVLTDLGDDDVARAVVRHPNGKLAAAGGLFRIALARYDASGALDTTFSGDGKVTTMPGNAEAFALLRQADGKLVVGGSGPVDGADAFLLARYDVMDSGGCQ